MSFWLITFLASKTKFRKRENPAMVCFYQRRNAPSPMWQQWMWRICEIKVQYGSGCQGFPNSITFMDLSHNKFKLSSTRETPSILFHNVVYDMMRRLREKTNILIYWIKPSAVLWLCPFPVASLHKLFTKWWFWKTSMSAVLHTSSNYSPQKSIARKKSPDCTCRTCSQP